jgi:protein gp37
MRQAHRFSGSGQPYEGLTELGPQGPRWNGTIRLMPEVLDAPLRWRQPRRIFVNSMSDLFHPGVPDGFIVNVLHVMARCPQHCFQVLTKRPARMRDVLSIRSEPTLPHVWWGVSVENQSTAEERVPLLLDTPAAVRFVSAEPMLDAIDLSPWLRGLDWVIVGGESGPGARPCHVHWIRSVVQQCRAAHVRCFVKQLGSVWAEQQVRVREWPERRVRWTLMESYKL